MNRKEDGTIDNAGTFAYDYDDHDDVQIRDVNWEDYNDNDYIDNSSQDNSDEEWENQQEDLEHLREKNLELRTEIEKLKRVDKKYSSLTRNAWHLKRLEFVWCSYPAIKWNIRWYFGLRGAQYFQLYLWIIRDFAWAQARFLDGTTKYAVLNYSFGAAIGALAVIWAALLFLRSIYHRQVNEIFYTFSVFLWQASTYWWCLGTLLDNRYNTDSREESRMRDCMSILIFTFLVQAFYHVIVRFWWKTTVNRVLSKFDEPRLQYATWHFQCIPNFLHMNWRDFEHFQILFWVGKEIGASGGNRGYWVICYLLTFFVALFLINSSINTRRTMIDHCHYLGIAIWLFGVGIVEMGPLFFKGTHNWWEYLPPRRAESDIYCYFYGSYAILFAFVPVIILHIIWIVATCLGLIKDDDVAEEEAVFTAKPMYIEESWLNVNKGDKFAPV